MVDLVSPQSRRPDLLRRAVNIIRQAGYLTLATADVAGRPWAAPLQYAWFTSPLSLVVGSHVAARHSIDVAATHKAAAALSVFPEMPGGLDGLQAAGCCTALTGAVLEGRAADFYRQVHPDPVEARSLALTPEQLSGAAPLRLYELRVDELWILDLDRWAQEHISTRVQIDPARVDDLLRGLSSAPHTQP